VGDEVWAARFPALFATARVGYANARVSFTTVPAESDDLNRLHLVAVTEVGHVVVCRSAQGWRFLPGGTREPGESPLELARRELREEAGGVLVTEPKLFARQVATTINPQPFRPHLAHPVSSWGYAVTRVEVTSVPSNPPGGEHVVEVLALPADEAAAYLRLHDDTHADVVLLAQAMGLIPAPGG
jgi:8-oxo-dGTP diphosphatase